MEQQRAPRAREVLQLRRVASVGYKIQETTWRISLHRATLTFTASRRYDRSHTRIVPHVAERSK